MLPSPRTAGRANRMSWSRIDSGFAAGGVREDVTAVGASVRARASVTGARSPRAGSIADR